MNNKFEFDKNKKGEHIWRKIAPNDKIIGSSSESFTSKQNAVKNARLNGYQGTGKRNNVNRP